MSDECGDQTVDSTGETNGMPDPAINAGDNYPLTFRGLVFWGIVIFLSLLGTCIIISILLALTRGS